MILMPEQNHIGIQSFRNNESAAAIAAYRIAVLDIAADDGMKLPAAASAGNIVGVTFAQVATGETGAVVFAGIAYVTAAAAVNRGDTLVVADTVGRVQAKDANPTPQGQGIIGLALKAAAAQGDVIPCLLQIRNEFVI
jgi:hypothetical protein